MPKIKVGRKVSYLEVFEIDTDKIATIRDDLDLCQRMLCCADPVFSQQLKSFTEDGKTAVRFLHRTQDGITKNPVYPAPNYPEGLDECPRYEEEE